MRSPPSLGRIDSFLLTPCEIVDFSPVTMDDVDMLALVVTRHVSRFVQAPAPMRSVSIVLRLLFSIKLTALRKVLLAQSDPFVVMLAL